MHIYVYVYKYTCVCLHTHLYDGCPELPEWIFIGPISVHESRTTSGRILPCPIARPGACAPTCSTMNEQTCKGYRWIWQCLWHNAIWFCKESCNMSELEALYLARIMTHELPKARGSCGVLRCEPEYGRFSATLWTSEQFLEWVRKDIRCKTAQWTWNMGELNLLILDGVWDMSEQAPHYIALSGLSGAEVSSFSEVWHKNSLSLAGLLRRLCGIVESTKRDFEEWTDSTFRFWRGKGSGCSATQEMLSSRDSQLVCASWWRALSSRYHGSCVVILLLHMHDARHPKQ